MIDVDGRSLFIKNPVNTPPQTHWTSNAVRTIALSFPADKKNLEKQSKVLRIRKWRNDGEKLEKRFANFDQERRSDWQMFLEIFFDTFHNFVDVSHMEMMRTVDRWHFKLKKTNKHIFQPSIGTCRWFTFGLFCFSKSIDDFDIGHWGFTALHHRRFDTRNRSDSSYPMKRMLAWIIRIASSASDALSGIRWN